MKLTGPIVTILVGAASFAMAWSASNGPPDHNIGRGIASSIASTGLMIVGGGVVAVGVIWLVLRLLDKGAGS